MPIVAGSSVHSTAVRMARPHSRRCSMLVIMEVPEREDEQAVSMLMAGPALCACAVRPGNAAARLPELPVDSHNPCKVLRPEMLQGGDW